MTKMTAIKQLDCRKLIFSVVSIEFKLTEVARRAMLHSKLMIFKKGHLEYHLESN